MITTYDIFKFTQKENRLTAQLMLALEMNKDPLLKRFLELCQLDCHIRSLDPIKSRLQAFEDASTPDAVLFRDQEKILFIECKLKGSIDTNQLFSHISSGKGSIPVVCVSRGKVEPEEIKQARENLVKQGFSQSLILWIGWQQIYTELVNLPRRMQEKPEIAGLIASLESEDLAARTFRGFKKEEMMNVTQLLMSYSAIFENTKQLLRDIIEYVKEKDSTIIVLEDKPHFLTRDSIFGGIFCWFAHAGWRTYHANLTFDFYERHICLAWKNIEAKQLKAVNSSQLENHLMDLKKKNVRLETDKHGKLEELRTVEDLKEIEDKSSVQFSCYYFFDNEILYKKPEDVVKGFAEDILWMLDFFGTRGLYAKE